MTLDTDASKGRNSMQRGFREHKLGHVAPVMWQNSSEHPQGSGRLLLSSREAHPSRPYRTPGIPFYLLRSYSPKAGHAISPSAATNQSESTHSPWYSAMENETTSKEEGIVVLTPSVFFTQPTSILRALTAFCSMISLCGAWSVMENPRYKSRNK